MKKEHKMDGMMKAERGLHENGQGGIKRVLQRGEMQKGEGGKMGKSGAARKGEFTPMNDGKSKYVP